MTFKNEQEEFHPVSKRDEYMQFHEFVQLWILTVRHDGHLMFLSLA